MGGGPTEDTPRARAAAAAAARFAKSKAAAGGGGAAATQIAQPTPPSTQPSPPSSSGAGTADDSDDDMDEELRAALALSMRPATPPAARAPLEDMVGLTATIKEVVWGGGIDPSERSVAEVLRRWAQGFSFSEAEPTALVQTKGGPCGVLAPVQGYLMKNLLFPSEARQAELTAAGGGWQGCTIMGSVLAWSLADILMQVTAQPGSSADVIVAVAGGGGEGAAAFDDLHAQIRYRKLQGRAAVEAELMELAPLLSGPNGVLLFLYSCIATRGTATVTDDLGIDVEPLVSMPFGHANLSLVNLLLTGTATAYVHDGIQDLGIPLRGIESKPSIGYLTILESLRYVTVGTFLKTPEHPIWVIGSETHMTVLFSPDTRLVNESDGETTVTKVERVFQEHDKTGGGFIMATELPALLTALGLDAGPENVARITRMMDGDIVLLTTFLEVQYPGIQRNSGPSDFVLYHYNGIPRSEGAPLQYSRGTAKTEAPRDFGTGTAMLQVLRTRWPRLEVDWSEPVSIS